MKEQVFVEGDSIRIENIRVTARHGVNEEEKLSEQPFEVNIELRADLSLPAKSDKIEDTISYSFICSQIKSIIEGTTFSLLERLANEILNTLFKDKRILAARVSIAKPEKLNGATPSVILFRQNPNAYR
jgi:dihydroneopterin aldolase